MELGNLELGLTLNHEQLKTELAGLENKIAKQVKAIKIPVSVNVTVNASSTGVNIATTGQSINTLGIINQLRNGTKEIKSTIVASSSLLRNVNTSLGKIENNLTKIEKIFSSAVRQFKINTFFSVLKTVGGGALKTVSKIAFAPITIPFNLVKGLLADISKGISTNIGMPLGVEIGRLLTKKSPLGKVKTIVAKVLKGFEVLDQEIIGKETVYETFLAELIKSGNIQKAVTASFSRTSLAKVTTRLGLLQKLAGMGELTATAGKSLLDVQYEFLESVMKEASETDQEFVQMYKDLIKKANISPTAIPKVAKTQKLKQVQELVKIAQPTQLAEKIINPLLNEIAPLLRFIQGMQSYHTSKLAQKYYLERKPAFPQLREGEDVVSVIGGAQNARGQGGRQIASAMEVMLPSKMVLPVENLDTDATEKTKQVDEMVGKFVKSLSQFGLTLDEQLIPTIVNLTRQVTFALNPLADSTAAAQAIAHTRLAQEQGKQGSVLSYSLGGADAYRYAQTSEYMGIPTKSLAMAYPFLNPSGHVPKGFNAGLLEKDPLGFPFLMGMGSGTTAFHSLQSDMIASGSSSVHGSHHLFKSPEFLDLLSSTTGATLPLQKKGLSMLGTSESERKSLSLLFSAGMELEKGIKSVESLTKMMAEGKIELSHIADLLSATKEVQALKGASASIQPIKDALLSVLEPAINSVLKFFEDRQMNIPPLEEMSGFAKYLGEIETLVNTLEVFRTGKVPREQSEAWFAGQLDLAEVARLKKDVDASFIPWVKSQKMGPWGDKLVSVLQEVSRVQAEFLATNGNLSQSFKDSIQQITIPPEKQKLQSVLSTFDETFPDRAYGSAYEQFKAENRRLDLVPAPDVLKKNPATILAYNELLKSLGAMMPEASAIKHVAYGMSGATAMLTEHMVYKTDLDPEGKQKIASPAEVQAYKRLQGVYAPLLYEAKQGESLVTERIKGKSLKDILNRLAQPIKILQEQIAKETDPAKQATLKTKLQKDITRFNKAAGILYEQVGKVGGAMHSMGVAHGDLASGNVFFTQKGVTSIDLGNAIVDPTNQQKMMDIATTMQRAIIDIDFVGILDGFKAMGAIAKGYRSTQTSMPIKRQINPALLQPAVSGTEIPIGVPASTYLEQFIPNIRELIEKTQVVNTASTQQIVTAVQEVSETIKAIPLVPFEPKKELEPVELIPPKQIKAQLLSLPEYPSTPTIPAEIEESSSTLEQVQKQVKAQLTPPSSSVDLIKLEAQLKKEKNQLARINLLPLSDEIKRGLLARQKGFNDLHRNFTEALKKGDFTQAKVLASALKEYGDKNSKHFDIYKKAIAELESQGIKTGIGDLGGDIQSLKAGITKKGQAKGIDQQIATAERRAMDKLIKEARKAGRNVGQGLAEGIDESLGIVEKSTEELANTVIETAKDELEIHSPSDILKGIGLMIGKGLDIGIRISGKGVATAMMGLFELPDPRKTLAKKQAILDDVLEEVKQRASEIQLEIQKSGEAISSRGVFASAGFTGTQGNLSQQQTVQQLRKVTPASVPIIPVSNKNTDIDVTFTQNPLKWLQKAIGKTGQLGVSTKINKDSIEMAAQVFARYVNSPQYKATLVGHSAGGYVVQEALAMLEKLGVQAKGISMGTPSALIPSLPSQGHTDIMSGKDPIGQITSFIHKMMGIKSPATTPYIQSGGHDLPDYLQSSNVIAELQKVMNLTEEEAKQMELLMRESVYTVTEEAGTGTQELFDNIITGIKGQFEKLPDFVKTPLSMLADIGKLAIAGMGFSMIQDQLRNLITESTQVALSFQRIRTTVNSMEKGGFEYAQKQAEKLNLDLEKTPQAYQQIVASAMPMVDAGQLMTQDVHNLFEGVTTASRAFNLSADDMQGALLAVGQIMGKGTVQAEELRGQLGERIPGAFQIAAKAMGMTTAQLNKQLSLGNISAVQFAKAFGQQLRISSLIMAQSSIGTASASIQAFQNNVKKIQDLIGSQLIPILGQFAQIGAKALEVLSNKDVLNSLLALGKAFSIFFLGLVIPSVINLTTNLLPLVSKGVRGIIDLFASNYTKMKGFLNFNLEFPDFNAKAKQLKTLQDELKGLRQERELLRGQAKQPLQLQQLQGRRADIDFRSIAIKEEFHRIRNAQLSYEGLYKRSINLTNQIKLAQSQGNVALANGLRKDLITTRSYMSALAPDYKRGIQQIQELNQRRVDLIKQRSTLTPPHISLAHSGPAGTRYYAELTKEINILERQSAKMQANLAKVKVPRFEELNILGKQLYNLQKMRNKITDEINAIVTSPSAGKGLSSAELERLQVLGNQIDEVDKKIVTLSNKGKINFKQLGQAIKAGTLLLAEMLAPLVAMESLMFMWKGFGYAFNSPQMKEVNKQLAEMNQQLQDIARTYQTIDEAQKALTDKKAIEEKQKAIKDAGYEGLGVFAKMRDNLMSFPPLGATLRAMNPIGLVGMIYSAFRKESSKASWGDIFVQNQSKAFDKAITEIGDKALEMKKRVNSKEFLAQTDQQQLDEYKGQVAELETLKQNAMQQKEISPEQALLKEHEIRQIEHEIQLRNVQIQRLTVLGDTIEGIQRRTELANQKARNDEASKQSQIERLQIEGVNTQEETERQKAKITEDRVQSELANEKKKLEDLQKLQGADPIKQAEEIKNSNQRIIELSNELSQSQNQLRQAELNALKAHLDKVVQEYERSNNKAENQLANAMTKFKARVLKLREEGRITESGATGLEAEARKKEAEENIKIEKNRLQQIAIIRQEAMASLVGKELTDKLAELDQQERDVQSKILNLQNDITQARIDAKKAERDALNEQIDLEYADLEMRTKRAFSRYANSQSEQERLLRQQRIKDIKERINAEEKLEGKKTTQLTGNNAVDIALLRKKFNEQLAEQKPYLARLRTLELKGKTETLSQLEIEEVKWLKKRTDLHTKEWYDLQNQLTELELEERKARQDAINELNDLGYKDLETRTKYAVQQGLMTQDQADKVLQDKKREGLKSRLLYEENLHKEQTNRLNELQLKATRQALTEVEKAELEWLKTRANLYSTEYYDTANQLIELQTEAEKKHYDTLITNIKKANQEKQLAYDNEKSRLERELKSQDLITKSIEKQTELINLRESVNKAISDSFVQQNESQITNTKRALELIKQIKSGELTKPEDRLAREELAMLGYNAKSKELDLVKKIADLESQQLAQKWESLMREQAVQRQLLDIELKKMDITAKRDEIEAKSGLLEAKKAVLDATVAIAEAEKQQATARTEDEKMQAQMAIQTANNQLLLSQQQVGLAEQNLGMVQTANQQQLEVKQLKQQELEVTQKTAQQTTLQELYTKKYSYALENVKTLNEAINQTGQDTTQDIDRRVALAQAWAEDTGGNPMARDWAGMQGKDALGNYAEFSMAGGGAKVEELRKQYAKEDQEKQLKKSLTNQMTRTKKGGWTTSDWVTPQFNAQLGLNAETTQQVSVTDQLQAQIDSGNATVEELKGIRSMLDAFKGTKPMMTLNNVFKNVATNITPEEMQRLRSETLGALVNTINGVAGQWAV